MRTLTNPSDGDLLLLCRNAPEFQDANEHTSSGRLDTDGSPLFASKRCFIPLLLRPGGKPLAPLGCELRHHNIRRDATRLLRVRRRSLFARERFLTAG